MNINFFFFFLRLIFFFVGLVLVCLCRFPSAWADGAAVPSGASHFQKDLRRVLLYELCPPRCVLRAAPRCLQAVQFSTGFGPVGRGTRACQKCLPRARSTQAPQHGQTQNTPNCCGNRRKARTQLPALFPLGREIHTGRDRTQSFQTRSQVHKRAAHAGAHGVRVAHPRRLGAGPIFLPLARTDPCQDCIHSVRNHSAPSGFRRFPCAVLPLLPVSSC